MEPAGMAADGLTFKATRRRALPHGLQLSVCFLLFQACRGHAAPAQVLQEQSDAEPDCQGRSVNRQKCMLKNTSLSRGSSLLTVSVERIRTLAGAFPGKIKAKSKTKRIVSGGGDSGGGDSIWANHNDTLLACGISYFAPGYGRCPDDCPFISLDPKHACYWRCLRAEQCGQDDPTQSIADIDYGVCRSCAVVGCGQCTPGKDICEQCKVGYELVGGDCRGRGRHIWKVLFATLGVLAIIIASWYVGLICSDARNPLVLKQALVHRARASLRDRRDGGDMAFPLLSNLWRTPKSQEVPIGGPGCMLLFSFQFYVLLWVILVIVGWLAGTWYLGSDALVVGTYLAVDTQEMCQAVQWGRQVHDRIRAGKLLITVIIYVLSTFFTIAFSVWHFRKFQEADSKTSTMMDYAAVCTGFPPDSGPQVEEDIQAFIQEVTGHSIVGVSVCWDFAAVEHQVLTLVTNEVRRREAGCLNDPCFAQYRMSSGGTRQTRWSQGDQMTARTYLASRVDCLFRPLFHLIDTVLGLPHHDHDDLENDESNTLETDHDKKVAAELFQEIANTGTAFVVFQTERDRDATVKILSTPLAPLYKGRYLIRATAEYYDPQAVCWSSFSVSSAQVVKRMCLGVVGTFVAIVIWGLCFYAPYAYFEAESYAATGEPPSFSSEVTFSMLVVIGNQIMYFFCSAIAERVGFRSKDHVQEAYVLLYTGAVLVNTLVDLGIVVCTTYMSMVARGVRTADGVLLKDLSNSTAVFESYPMMKVFGRTLYEYNFPSCFLIPFIAEAIFTVCLPYHIGYRLVRARSLSRQNAESCLQPIPMDLARYGDIVVNIILSTVCFYTASGWILKTFVGLLIGNVFVYIFDHYRVLRQVENFYLASGAVDAAVQRLLCLPCAVLATAVVFQLYAIFPTSSILSAQSLALLICETFLLHILLHLFLMAYALKHFGKVNHETTDIHYDEVARDWPGNWFTSNPVHCLRSLHLHEHTKPCVFYIKGKEAYLQMDEVQGLYFKPLHRNPADEVF